MATVGLLSFSDGRDFAHEIVRPESGSTERAMRARSRRAGTTVVSAEEPVWSNDHAVHEGRRLRAVNPDCVVFNFSVWAFPHFAMLAASEITSPLILLSNLDPARPGLVAMLAAAGGLDQVGRRYARVWGDIGDADGARPPRGCRSQRRPRRQPASRDDLRTHRRTPDGDVHGHGGHGHLARPVRHRRRGGRPVRARAASGGGGSRRGAAGAAVARGELPRRPLRRPTAHAGAARASAAHVPRHAGPDRRPAASTSPASRANPS